MEIVAEVSEDVWAFEDALQESVLSLEVAEVLLLGDAEILVDIVTRDELVLEAVNGPPDVRRQGPVVPAIGRFCLPDEFSLVLEEYMLIRPLNQEPLDPQMRQDCQGALGMPERVCRNGDFRTVLELLLEEPQP